MQEINTYPTGERLRQARIAAKITQSEMALLLCVARQTYSYLEQGQVDPRFSLLLKIANLTGQPLSFFYDQLSVDAQEQERLVNSSRNQGIVYACSKLAELYDQTDLAVSLIDTIGITIDCGRPKDAQKLKELITKKGP